MLKDGGTPPPANGTTPAASNIVGGGIVPRRAINWPCRSDYERPACGGAGAMMRRPFSARHHANRLSLTPCRMAGYRSWRTRMWPARGFACRLATGFSRGGGRRAAAPFSGLACSAARDPVRRGRSRTLVSWARFLEGTSRAGRTSRTSIGSACRNVHGNCHQRGGGTARGRGGRLRPSLAAPGSGRGASATRRRRGAWGQSSPAMPRPAQGPRR
jgi:hypothetical protein